MELGLQEQLGSPLPLPRTNCRQSSEVPPAKLCLILGQLGQHGVPLSAAVSPGFEDTGHLLSFMLIRQCIFFTVQSEGFRDL